MKASSPAWKELESHHSHPDNKGGKKKKKSTTLLRSIRELRSKNKLIAPNRRDRKSDSYLSTTYQK